MLAVCVSLDKLLSLFPQCFVLKIKVTIFPTLAVISISCIYTTGLISCVDEWLIVKLISVCVISSRHETWQAVSLSLIVSLVSQHKCNHVICGEGSISQRFGHPTMLITLWGHENFVENSSGMRMHWVKVSIWVWVIMNKAAVYCHSIVSLSNTNWAPALIWVIWL